MAATHLTAKKDFIESWWIKDYSWDGLAKHLIAGWRVVDGTLTPDAGDTTTGVPATLQHLFREEENRLVDFGGRRWTVFHCPIQDRAGELSPKALWASEKIDAFNDEIRTRLGTGARSNIDWKGEAAEGSPDMRAILRGCVFPGRFNFRDSTPIHADFQDCWFKGEVVASRDVFGPGAWFSDSLFESRALFSNTIFLGRASFYGCTFLDLAEFYNAHFRAKISFFNAHFLADANFAGARLDGYAWFTNARFETAGIFRRTVWRDLPAFERCHLHPDSTFDGARFSKLSDVPRLGAIGGALIVGGSCLVSRLVSPGDPDLATILLPVAAAMLAWIKFGGVLCGVLWQNLNRFRIRAWAPEPSDRYATFRSVEDEFERLARAFRTLTLLNEQVRNRRDAARFFILEMKATRLRAATALPEKTASLIYDWLAGYGESLVRPAIALIAVAFVGALTFTAMHNGRNDGERFLLATVPLEIEPGALSFSLRNMVQPFAVWASPLDEPRRACGYEARLLQLEQPSGCPSAPNISAAPDERRLTVRILASAQSFASIVFFFLLALALRRRFQVS